MNIMTWASFCWDLAKSDLPESVAPKHYRLRIVGTEDYEETRKMIARSFALDPNWNSALHEANAIVGTLLLVAAMQHLRDAGLKRACAITRQGSSVARFLYPKFDGHPSAIAPLLAA